MTYLSVFLGVLWFALVGGAALGLYWGLGAMRLHHALRRADALERLLREDVVAKSKANPGLTDPAPGPTVLKQGEPYPWEVPDFDDGQDG